MTRWEALTRRDLSKLLIKFRKSGTRKSAIFVSTKTRTQQRRRSTFYSCMNSRELHTSAFQVLGQQ